MNQLNFRPLPLALAGTGGFGGTPMMPPGTLQLSPEEDQRMKKQILLDQQKAKERSRYLSMLQEGTAVYEGVSLCYRFYIPPQLSPEKKYPLVLFLHGGGERGNDNVRQITAYDGACVWIREQLAGNQEPCIVLAPQCPTDGYWLQAQLLPVMQALETMCAAYPVDRKRLYITGMSMGGGGCWRMNYMFPSTFAATVAVCSAIATIEKKAINPEAIEIAAETFAGKNLWLFHAADDNVVPVETSRRLAEALTQRHSACIYTEYPSEQGYRHGSWNPAYEWEPMRRWLFQQRLPE